MIIHLHLSTVDASQLSAEATAFTRDVETGQVPSVTDDVELWPDMLTRSSGTMLWPVHRRWLAADGCWHVDLGLMVFGIDDAKAEGLARWGTNGHHGRHPFPGRDREDQVQSILRRAGWWRYGETALETRDALAALHNPA